MASDEAGDTASGSGKMSVTVWCVLMVVLTVIAGGGGAAFGFYLTTQAKALLGPEVKEAAAETPAAAPITNSNVRELPPIITNMGQTSDVWVRLHAAIVFEPGSIEKPEIMAADISADILGFLQTLSVSQLTGPSGLEHLREDLNDRAIVRSDGRIRELVVESVVVQ